jgi:hypothetical protein
LLQGWDSNLGTIPAPNLVQDATQIAQAPQNALMEYQRMAALKQQTALMQQQQQAAAQENQMRQRQIADQDALTKTIAQYDPNKNSLDDIPHMVTQNGGSGQAAIQAQQGLLQQRQNYLKMTDEQFAQEQRKSDLVQGVHDAVSQAKPEEKQAIYQQGIQQLAHAGVNVGNEPLQYPGDEAFAQHLPAIRLHSQVIAEAEKDRELSAKELTAQAQAAKSSLEAQEFKEKLPGGSLYSPTDAALLSRAQNGDKTAAALLQQKQAFEATTAAAKAQAENPFMIQRSAAQGAAMAALARGTNPALANVPKELITPASAAAEKASTKYSALNSQIGNLKAQIAAARTGDELANAFAPTASILGSNAFFGTHRIAPAEAQAMGPHLGSVARQFDTFFSKLTKGELPEDSRKEFDALVDRLATAAGNEYKDSLAVTNHVYGSDFKPMQLSGSQPAQPAKPTPPQGATGTALGKSDRKLHYHDAQGRDLGLVSP